MSPEYADRSDDEHRPAESPATPPPQTQHQQPVRYLIYTFIVLGIIVGIAIWFGFDLGEAEVKLLTVVILSGACGGILYAVRHSILTWPKLDRNLIHLGWLTDCAYGVAGAFCVFLLVPGLSESAVGGFHKLFPPPGAAAGSNENDSKMDLIEVIAVALEIDAVLGKTSAQTRQNIFEFLKGAAERVGNEENDGILAFLRALENPQFGPECHEVSRFRAEYLDRKGETIEAYDCMSRARAGLSEWRIQDQNIRQEYREIQEYLEGQLRERVQHTPQESTG